MQAELNIIIWLSLHKQQKILLKNNATKWFHTVSFLDFHNFLPLSSKALIKPLDTLVFWYSQYELVELVEAEPENVEKS